MRWKVPAGALLALAFLIPAAPAMAQVESPGLNAACQTVERKVHKDIRKLLAAIDLDTATTVQLRVLTAQILADANANKFPVLPGVIQKRLDGTTDDLRAFLKTDVQKAWLTDLRISVVRTLTDAGPNVKAATQKVLDEGEIDAYLAYLNDGLYAARALDCASQPTPTPTSQPTPSATPSATTTVAPTPTSSASLGAPGGENGEGGGLPVTGANTAIVAGVGGALLLLGGAGYLIGRRRRSSFVA
ncbi:LPXTG-motif cell wall-anchored protein [Micromonospora jinlongensis]|uniref:LPXTG-motif cell wall-anchored protein n=1 Tax=Micromonospora jinlongensis TaxID=1287877 RepID=A0A7Y9X641_9ACTN|nr:LPXTG cell wall anchor domain-containing protein [Micromonospora jinlongensis]NYH44550.1 LPXTG-motif cell wall-anchored protein [Micromonospora jinlongensis]